MDDLFASLTSGLKFNRKINGNAIKVFAGHSEVGDNSMKGDLIDAISGRKSSTKRKQSSIDTEEDSNDNQESYEDLANAKDEDINAFRNKLNIRVRGQSCPNPCASFESMSIHESIKHIVLTNIEKSAWKEPTPIQMQAIPAFLDGRDLLASAPTGSGKTAAYVIPILSKISSKLSSSNKANETTTQKKIQSIIIAPTKELSEQIYNETTFLCQGKKIKIKVLKPSSSSSSSTAASINHDKQFFKNTDLIISTPMRLIVALRNGVLDLNEVHTVVLDEVDKLFEHDMIAYDEEDPTLPDKQDTNNKNNKNNKITTETDNNDNEDQFEPIQSLKSSFLTQMDEILSYLPSTCQKCLFSATINSKIEDLSVNVLNPHPLKNMKISIGVYDNIGAQSIEQELLFVGREDGKLLAIRQIIQKGIQPPVLIFMQSIDRAKELYRELVYDGVNVDMIHSDRTAQQREEVIRSFRLGKIWILICTDLMARGVDFKGVQMVINYDLPQTAVAYIHRIGRTGRANRRGRAVTLFTEADMPNLRAIANVVKLSGCHVPDWMLSIRKLSTKEKRTLRKSAPERRQISTEAKYDKIKKAKKTQMIKQSQEKKLRTMSNAAGIGAHDGNGGDGDDDM